MTPDTAESPRPDRGARRLNDPPGTASRPCQASMTIDGTATRLTCDRSPGHIGLHRDGTLWWAGTDNRGITRDGTTRDRLARSESAEECLSTYAGFPFIPPGQIEAEAADDIRRLVREG